MSNEAAIKSDAELAADNARQIDKAFRKLSRESAPAKVLRAPFQLAQTRAEIERFESAKKKRIESRMMAFLHRKSTADAPLALQLQALKIREEALANDFIEGTLTPLTEAENWEVRCEWAAIKKTLLEHELELQGAAREAYHAETEKASTGIWIQKWVAIALKKKEQVNGKWERYAGPGELNDVEPVTLNYLFNLYHEAFNLTDDELKKLQAPTTKTS